jgi:hypothetical protein
VDGRTPPTFQYSTIPIFASIIPIFQYSIILFGRTIMEKGRIILVLLLVATGAGLLLYGLLYNSTIVASGPSAPAAVAGEPDFVPIAAQAEALSEPAVTEEVARGGVTRDETGAIRKTYEGKEAPKACPT